MLLEGLESDPISFGDAIYSRCADDVELFAKIFFPHYCKFPFNQFHRDTFADYKFGERDVRRASSAPRGFAKSTIKALIKPIHDVCYGLEKFIVIISNTEDQAVQKLKDIQTELTTNDFLIGVYGRFIKSKKIGTTDFVCNGPAFKIRLLALGSGTEMRGIRFGDVRPTKIILDDVEHSEEVESENLRHKMLDWYNDVVSKIGDEQTNIEFVGTVLHQKSLLKHLLKNARYQTRQYKAIISWSEREDLWNQWKDIYCNLDDDNRLENAEKFYLDNKDEMLKGADVLWPEKEPYYRLQVEIVETGYRSFMKEKQNDPMSDEEKVFDPNDFWFYEETPHGLFIEKTKVLVPWNMLTPYGVIDPSTGQSKASSNKKPDYSAIINGYGDQKGRVFVHDDWLKRASPSQFIRQILEFNKKYQHYKFGVETNLFRNLLMDNIKDEKARFEKEIGHSLPIKFYDIYLTDNKEKRIHTLEPKVKNGWLLFNKKLSTLLLDQFYDFPKGQHDDGPDAVEMLVGLITKKYDVRGF